MRHRDAFTSAAGHEQASGAQPSGAGTVRAPRAPDRALGRVLGRVLAVSAATALLLAGAGRAGAADALTVAAISETSDTYMLAVGWSAALRSAGLSHAITPISGGGTIKLLRGVAQGKWDIGFVSTPHYTDALKARRNFKDDPPELLERYKSVRALFGITSGMGHYVARADTGIRTIADLKGHVVSVGQPGGGGSKITPALFKHHGAEAEKDYRVVFLKDQAALDEMRNGKVDVAAVWGGVPQPAILNFSRQFPIRLLSLDPVSFDAFRKDFPGGSNFVLRAFDAAELKKVYGDALDQEGMVYFFTFPMQVVARADMPEQTAYEIVKAFWEHLDEVKAVGAALSSLSSKDAVESLSAQLHPGAQRYYRERGWLN
ncbi:MAG: TAXI family TRAP transporter solute-binding subunit [Burkholderiales bacterium]|nr:MAG: TAXI family TRAP transporter solute-binding subunit [Burkholderiales bacterium]